MRQFRKPTPAMIAVFVAAVLILLRISRSSNEGREGISETRTAMIAHVIDGDTIETDEGERIRLLGIDAPEIAHHGREGEHFGSESTQWLSREIRGKVLTLHIGQERVDRYGRTLAWVYQSDGTFVNEQILSLGMAKLLDAYGLPANLETRLRSAEALARAENRGLWRQ